MRSRMAEAPVAFFGFDAAESSLVRHGIEEGWLPTLASLAEAGRWAALAPVPSGFYNTSWASTVTGQDVFAHQGLYDRQLEPGSYRIVDVPATSIRQPPFWRYLSDAGVRSTIASIYSAPILPSFRGSQAQGWGSIDPYFAKFEETTFEPPDIEQVLRRAAGVRQALYRIRAPKTSDDVRRYRDLLLRSIDQQTRGVIALVEETDWNFFFASFSEPHQAGHLLWHLTDPAHPSYDPEAEGDLKEALPAIYRAVDEGIGQTIERLPDGCRTFVVTPHGMAPNYIQDPSEALLESGGWLVRRVGVSGGGGLRRQAMRTAWSVGRRVTPTRLRLAAQSRLSRDGVRAQMPLAHVDWQRTRAFALPSDMTAYVRVNLQGREPEGIVAPGREYEQLCNELGDVLGSLTHAVSGAPAVERVIRYDTLFGRPAEGSMPDLCVVWADTQRLDRLTIPGHGTIEAPTGDPRTGQHRHLGFLLGAGPGIGAGREEASAGLLDVAPTALALLGVDQPTSLPGTPIEAFAGD
jgi:predicted AlkP superfamily phosphohydrolase/phosphomutase